MTKKIINIVVNCLLLLSIYCVVLIEMKTLYKLLLFSLVIISLILFLIFKIFSLHKISKFFYIIYIFSAILIICYYFLQMTGILATFSSINGLKNYILSTKSKGVLIYILIQMAQVVILPIPAAIICIAGSAIYGPLLGGIYCSIGVLLGSFVSFYIGKTFGYRVVSWIVGKDNTDKYSEIIRKRGGFFLILAFLLPMFPDDILCLIVGITKMNFKTFFFIALITRPIGVIAMSYFGCGYIIPFSGWGIYAWCGILIVSIILVILVYKYQDKMQNYIISKVYKK